MLEFYVQPNYQQVSVALSHFQARKDSETFLSLALFFEQTFSNMLLPTGQFTKKEQECVCISV